MVAAGSLLAEEIVSMSPEGNALLQAYDPNSSLARNGVIYERVIVPCTFNDKFTRSGR
jgi:hypothetical protein